MNETFDFVIKDRVRAVLDGDPVTEAQLRKLLEEARACALILHARLDRSEQRLAELALDPTSSLTEAAAMFRRISDVRTDLDELEMMLTMLDERAREFRSSWLTSSRSSS